MIGQTLAHYLIESRLGAGGMGEVYRARDTRLGRSVALKFLPEAFAQDPERIARLEREAKMLASLNHANIAALFGFEEFEQQHFLVIELIEGETLAERIARARGPMPVEEALKVAVQMAEALESAHECGVIHRDLKPQNVKITPEGKVKVLDFGLAKAIESSPAHVDLPNSPTLSMAATNAGMILGTAAYMSPEQAKGKSADQRSDVFSFGCVLFEMLTGRQAFQGETAPEILASVLVREPDFTLLPPDLNTRLVDLLRRCLDKNPKRRWHAAADLRMELETVASDPRRKPEIAPEAGIVARARMPKLRVTITAGLLLAAGALFAVLIQSYRPPRESPAVRFMIPSPDKTTFDSGLLGGGAFISSNAGSISPDSRWIAFTARDEAGKVMLWVRALDAIIAHSLPSTENAGLPFWSPDSKSIGFFTPGKLKKIDVEGGPAQTICDAPNGRGGTWNRDGVIVFAPNNPSTSLLRVSASGGEPSPVTKLQSGENDHRNPSFLPDGKHFLYWGLGTSENSGVIFVGSLDSFEARRLLATDTAAIYAPPGYLMFGRQGTLLAQPFDTTKLEVMGEAVPIAEQVAFDGSGRGFSVSENGTLAYRNNSGASQYQLVWVDRTGTVIESAGVPALYQSPAISPDGKRIAVHRHDGNGGDIWLVEASGGKVSRLTFDESQENSQPIWSADGSRIVFGSRRMGKWGIYQKLSNGTGNEELLFESDVLKMPMSWSAAVNTVLFYVADPKNAADVWALPLAGDRKPLPVLQTAFDEAHPQISPDGKWFAYRSNETGRGEIYVQSFPPGGGKWQISSNGGTFARWRPDGKELFYMERASFGKVVAVGIHATGSTFEFSAPRPLFDSGYLNNVPGHTGSWNTFYVSSDGQRFLIPRPEAANTTGALANTPITVVLNWTAALNKK